ncbi:MAG TPA: ATP-binding protein [Microlunatus sp.]
MCQQRRPPGCSSASTAATYGRARTQGGTGLGLSIAAGLMAAHGGAITHSETPGGGSTFTLTFPGEERAEPYCAGGE